MDQRVSLGGLSWRGWEEKPLGAGPWGTLIAAALTRISVRSTISRMSTLKQLDWERAARLRGRLVRKESELLQYRLRL